MATLERPEAGAPARRRTGVGKIVFLSALGMLLLLAAMFTIGSLVSSWQLESELDKIRAANEPLTAADLDALYVYPPKDGDTTELWLDAFGVLDSPAYQSDAQPLPYVGDGAAVPLPGEPWTQLDAAEAFLEKYRGPLEKMHQATELGGEARFPIDLSGAAATPLQIRQLWRGAMLLMLESEVDARRNHPHAAAKALTTAFASTRALERQPIYISQLYRTKLNAAACSQIERFLSACDFSDEDLVHFDRDLAAIDEKAAFRRALLHQRAIMVQDWKELSKLAVPMTVKRRLFSNADEFAYLNLTARYIAACDSKLPLFEAIELVHAEAANATNSWGARQRFPMTSQMLPSSLQTGFKFLIRAQAQQAATRTAIAIERYRRIHGGPPKTLDLLVPEFLEQSPVDPFDGAPLRYRSGAGGYKIYSIGPDGIDRGGEPGEDGQELDIVFEVPIDGQRRN